MMALAPAALLALGGCMQQWRPEPPRAGPCTVGEEAKMRFAGVRFHDVRREAIERATNSRLSRVLRPGDAATMDFRPDRLNIMVDDDGQITGLRCG